MKAFTLAILITILPLTSQARVTEAQKQSLINHETCQAVAALAAVVGTHYYMGTSEETLYKMGQSTKSSVDDVLKDIIQDAYGEGEYLLQRPVKEGTQLFKNRWLLFCQEVLK